MKEIPRAGMRRVAQFGAERDEQVKEKYEMMQTKVHPVVYARVKRIMKLKGLSDYNILQMMVDCIVRYMDDRHNLTPEMEQLMSIFEHMEGWRDALNIADPSVRRVVGEAIYFLFDEEGKKKGCRAVHVTKPFFGHWSEDMNVQHILERALCLLMPERYRRLRALAVDMECSSMLELFDKLIDHHTREEDAAELRRGFEDADRAENGKPLAYGQRTRRKKHTSPDSLFGDDPNNPTDQNETIETNNP